MGVYKRYRPSKSLFRWMGIWGLIVIGLAIFDKDFNVWSWVIPGVVVWGICFTADYVFWRSDRRMHKIQKKLDDECNEVVKKWGK